MCNNRHWADQILQQNIIGITACPVLYILYTLYRTDIDIMYNVYNI